jgi:hypothetical protein
VASALSVVPFSFLTALRVVLAWYLFNWRRVSVCLILFFAD